MYERGVESQPAGHQGPVARWRARRAAENAALAEADAQIPSQLDRWNLERLDTWDADEPDA
jgi:hypothetical protein